MKNLKRTFRVITVLFFIAKVSSSSIAFAGCFLPFDTLKVRGCAASNEVCFTGLSLNKARKLNISIDGSPFTGILAGCDIDTLISYTIDNVFPVGPYRVDSWSYKEKSTGIVHFFSGNFADFAALTDSLNKWDPKGKWVYSSASKSIEGGSAENAYNPILITEIFTGNPKSINPNYGENPKSTIINFGQGIHQVIFSDSLCTDTVEVILACPTSEVITKTIVVGNSDTFCLDFKQLFGSIVFVTNICPSNSGTEVSFNSIKGDSCLTATALGIGKDTACIVACDQFGFCDTTIFIITGRSLAGTTLLHDTILVNSEKTLCPDKTHLTGNVVSIANSCPNSSGTNLTYSLDTVNHCVKINGTSQSGTDTLCIVLCDNKGICDTTIWYVYVKPMIALPDYSDTVYINQSKTICIGVPLPKNVVKVKNYCLTLSGFDADIQVQVADTACQNAQSGSAFLLSYSGIQAGKDTACLEITDADGNKDTVLVCITVLAPAKQVLKDTINPNITIKKVLSTSELSGTTFTITNICPGNSGKNVKFVQDTTNKLCIYATGISEGEDTACWVICDQNNLCDTTIWIVSVTSQNRPVLVDDVDTVLIGGTKTTNILANDNVVGAKSRFFILPLSDAGVGPLYGFVMLDSITGVATYVNTSGDCGKSDFYKYVVCNSAGCDTALVNIFLKCKEESKPFKIYNALSPNEDDDNDAFIIDGLDKFPNHTLCVYDRWGHQILNTKNYNNDWKGTWNGKILPDGTYFYVFDNGQGGVNTGYIEIRR